MQIATLLQIILIAQNQPLDILEADFVTSVLESCSRYF